MNPFVSASEPMDVAVGIVRDDAGRVLVNRRQAGKAFAGLWEFPGGKIEPGESMEQALARELHEELGITVRRQRPLIRFPYYYDDLTVRLRVNEVLDYEGVPSGLEGQLLDWVAPEALDRIDLLAANSTIVRAVVLPRTCLITDTARYGESRTLDRLAAHVAGRRVLVIVREKTMAGDHLRTFIEEVNEICRPAGAMVCIHADCAAGARADGVHLPARVLEQETLSVEAGIIGVSCHTGAELRTAAERGADYALLSPVKHTASHPDAKPMGWPRFGELCADIPIPVYALGGMTPADQDTAIEHGAQGAAMLGAAWD
ncbi:MAG: Nudix family hydrolase [Gammaproteobacteria bacterium]|nr:Nudix family hydrolase [Gammaproteobacteria bacterium]